MLDLLVLPQPLQQLHDLVLAFRRGQHGHVLPDGFLGCVAVQALGGGVPVRDAAVERLGADRILRGLDQGGELGDTRLGGLAFADVPYGRGDEEPVSRLQGAEADLDGELAAVLA